MIIFIKNGNYQRPLNLLLYELKFKRSEMLE